jgi:hypothetical protein
MEKGQPHCRDWPAFPAVIHLLSNKARIRALAADPSQPSIPRRCCRAPARREACSPGRIGSAAAASERLAGWIIVGKPKVTFPAMVPHTSKGLPGELPARRKPLAHPSMVDASGTVECGRVGTESTAELSKAQLRAEECAAPFPSCVGGRKVCGKRAAGDIVFHLGSSCDGKCVADGSSILRGREFRYSFLATSAADGERAQAPQYGRRFRTMILFRSLSGFGRQMD